MRNIDILQHFDEVLRADRITVFKLKPAERSAFFGKLPLPFRELYISNDDVDWGVTTLGGKRDEEIAERIPTLPILKSGEFSEILTYFLVPERYEPACQLRPPKWRWKESKDIPAHFTDVIFFNQLDDDLPQTNDSVISVETKSRASRPGPAESSLQKAINDVEKDFASRLSESFFHLKTRYKIERDLESLKRLERFMDAVKYPTYLKHFKAVAVVDELYGDHHIDQITSMPIYIRDSFQVILIRIQDMKEGYEKTFAEILLT